MLVVYGFTECIDRLVQMKFVVVSMVNNVPCIAVNLSKSGHSGPIIIHTILDKNSCAPRRSKSGQANTVSY